DAVGDSVLVYLGGGADALSERFSPASQQWTPSAEPKEALNPGVYTSVVHGGPPYILVLAPKPTPGGHSASGRAWEYTAASKAWAKTAQRARDSRDALFMVVSLGSAVYFVGAFTEVTVK